jgi:hypothetical protein
VKLINNLPIEYVENKTCKKIYENLNGKLDCSLVVRNWQSDPVDINEKHIVLITSAEGHTYIPPEVKNENCLGVFMHYYPKKEQYNPSDFVRTPKLYPLQLGCTDFFQDGEIKPLKERKFDCCFIGQLDPYRRMPFFDCVRVFSSIEGYNNNIAFYQGWNNGYSGEEYSKIMRDSKIAFVPWGSASLDTFRFYEAARSGCIIVSSPQNKYDFMENSPHIETTWNPNTLEKTVSNILYDENLAERTYNFWLNSLSPEASANYILSKVKI